MATVVMMMVVVVVVVMTMILSPNPPRSGSWPQPGLGASPGLKPYLVLWLGPPVQGAQDDNDSTERRASSLVDRRAKHLYDKAIELMEYKQYERGLTMLDTVIRDNQGNILGYQAHMAKGRHYLEQRKSKEALSHFLLLSRLLAPLPGHFKMTMSTFDDGCLPHLCRPCLH